MREIGTMRRRRRRPLQAPMKRGFDIGASFTGLLLSSPAMLVLAVLIRRSIGPPILFRQPRLGYLGRPFVLYKFRTMNDDRDELGNLLPDEARITRVGRFLRRTSLDELPQLLNVLRGEMSVVGPRPLLPEYRDRYSPEQWRRHETRPGVTGAVQVRGRNTLSWEEKFALDVWYVDNWSLWLDMKIIASSVWKVIRMEGISAEGHATMPPFEGSAAADVNEPR